MADTSFKFPPLFRKPKNVEIPKRLGVRAVVVDSSNNFLLTLQDILNPDFSLMLGKMQVVILYCRFSHFLLMWQDYRYDPILVDLTSNFFVLCTNMKVYLYSQPSL